MPPTPSTCLTCGKPFAANRELATIPDASKIAFDPINSRVWRVCASCDEWNLLGPEASAAALPELEARYRAVATPRQIRFGLDPATVSSRLELLRLEKPHLMRDAEVADLRVRDEADKRIRALRWLPWLGGAGLLAAIGYMVYIEKMDGDAFHVAVLMLLTYAQTSLVSAVVRKIRGRRVSPRTFYQSGGLTAFALLLIALFLPMENLKYTSVAVAMMFPFYFIIQPIIERHLTSVNVTLAHGRKLHVTEPEVRNITLSWPEGGTEVMLHDLPGGGWLMGPDVLPVYRRVYALIGAESFSLLAGPKAMIRDSYTLLRSLGGLAGLLRALEGFKRDSDGRVLIADLPLLYLSALDLGLTAEEGGELPPDTLREKALAAAEVAKEAEALDRGDD